MNSNLDLDLLASIASGGLGHWIDGDNGAQQYLKDDDCLACLKDLQSFFRYDDPEERPAFFAISHYNFARSDLVPLIVSYPDDYDVVYNALKVCAFLTMTSEETSSRLISQEAEKIQQVCEAFLAQDALAVIVSLLADPLSRHPKMTEKDTALVELVISFLDNLLSATIPHPSAAPTTIESGKRIRNGLIDRFMNDDVLDLLLLIAQHARERPFKSQAKTLLTIFLNTFYGKSPQDLLESHATLSAMKASREAHIQRTTANNNNNTTTTMNGTTRRRTTSGTAMNTNSNRVGIAARRPSVPLAAAPALPLPSINKSVARFGPSRQQFAGAVYIRRHTDHSAHTVLRHNPHRKELPSIPAVTNPRQAKAQKKDFEIGAVNDVVSASARASGQQQQRRGTSSINNNAINNSATTVVRSMKEAELLAQMDTFFSRFLEEAYTPLVGQVFKDVRPGLGVSHLEEEDFERYARFVTLCTQYVRMREEKSFAAKQLESKKRKEAVGDENTKEVEDDAISLTRINTANTAGATVDTNNTDTAIDATTTNNNNNTNNNKDDDDRSPFECISCTMGWDSFHFVQVVLLMAAELEARKAREKKRKITQFTLYWSLAPLLREMLLTLDLARVAGNTEDQKAADRLQKRLMHDDGKESGLLPVLVRLIREYNFQYQPRSHAVNLIQVLHIVLGTLDRLSRDPSGFRVRQDVAGRSGGGGGRKSKSKKTSGSGGEGVAAIVNKKLSPQLVGDVAVMEKGGDVVIVDNSDNGNSDDGEKQQQQDKGDGDDDNEVHAASLILPDDSPSQQQENEKKDDDVIVVDGDTTNKPALDNNNQHDDDDDDDDSDDEEDQHHRRPRFREVSLDLHHRIRQTCAHPAIIHFYTWLLQGYRTNTPSTNHAIVSFLERIASPAPQGLGLESMLWQLSILRLFHAIMADPIVRSNSIYSELMHLCVRTTRNLFARLVPDTSEIEERIDELKRKKEQLEDEVLIAEAQQLDDDSGEDNTTTANKDTTTTDELKESIKTVDRELTLAQTELKMKEGCSALGFIELLFWKTSTVAEIMAEEYNWKKAINTNTNTNHAAADNSNHQLGFASYKGPTQKQRKGEFSEEQTTTLLEAFDRCNGKKDCLDILVFEFGGAFKKVHISRKLKELGLVRGKFTRKQEETLRSLFELHADKGPKYKFFAIAEDLGAGFSENQVKRQLRNMGLIPGGSSSNRKNGSGGGSGNTNTNGPSWDDVFGSDDDDDVSEKDGEERRNNDNGGDRSDDDSDSSDSDDDDDDVRREDVTGGAIAINTTTNATTTNDDDNNDDVEPMTGVEDTTNTTNNNNGDSSAANKKKRSATDATLNSGPTAEQRAKALELLRMRRGGGGNNNTTTVSTTDHEDGDATKTITTAATDNTTSINENEQGGDGSDDGSGDAQVDNNENDRQENNQQSIEQSEKQQPVKTFGRRLKKLGGGDGEVSAPAVDMSFDDLFDDV